MSLFAVAFESAERVVKVVSLLLGLFRELMRLLLISKRNRKSRIDLSWQIFELLWGVFRVALEDNRRIGLLEAIDAKYLVDVRWRVRHKLR